MKIESYFQSSKIFLVLGYLLTGGRVMAILRYTPDLFEVELPGRFQPRLWICFAGLQQGSRTVVLW